MKLSEKDNMRLCRKCGRFFYIKIDMYSIKDGFWSVPQNQTVGYLQREFCLYCDFPFEMVKW